MPKSPEIPSGGIDPIGYGTGSTSYYYPARRRKSTGPKRLKIGEIVLGTIINVISHREAVVRLPNGTFMCVIEGKFKKGDTLFFKVFKIEPALVLKIYAAPISSSGKTLSNVDLVRMLDLPETVGYADIVDILRSFSNVIIRDEVLLIVRDYNALSGSFLADRDYRQVIKTIQMLRDADMEVNDQNAGLYYPLWEQVSVLEKALYTIEKNIKQLPEKLSESLHEKFLILHNPSPSPAELIDFFTSDDSVNKSLHNLLFKMLEDHKDDEYFRDIRESTELLLGALDAQDLWNSKAVEKDEPLYFFIPISGKGDYSLARISIMRKVRGMTPSAMQFYPESAGLPDYYTSYLRQVMNILAGRNFIVRSISIGRSDEDEELLGSNSQKMLQSFSVVV